MWIRIRSELRWHYISWHSITRPNQMWIRIFWKLIGNSVSSAKLVLVHVVKVIMIHGCVHSVSSLDGLFYVHSCIHSIYVHREIWWIDKE